MAVVSVVDSIVELNGFTVVVTVSSVVKEGRELDGVPVVLSATVVAAVVFATGFVVVSATVLIVVSAGVVAAVVSVTVFAVVSAAVVIVSARVVESFNVTLHSGSFILSSAHLHNSSPKMRNARLKEII